MSDHEEIHYGIRYTSNTPNYQGRCCLWRVPSSRLHLPGETMTEPTPRLGRGGRWSAGLDEGLISAAQPYDVAAARAERPREDPMSGPHRPWEVHGTTEYTPEMLAVLERMAPHLIPRPDNLPSIFGEPFRNDEGATGTDILENVRVAMAEIEKAKRVILAPPELVEQVRAIVEASPAPGLLEVRSSEIMPKGQVIILDPNMLTRRIGEDSA